MLGLFSTTSLLSLLSVVSSSSEYPKSSQGWYPLSSLGSISESRDERDRRSTHWESRTHSNLDDDRRRVDDDRDGGHGEISYPLLVDQLSPLGFPRSQIEEPGKSTNVIDFSEDEGVDNDSRLDHCITIVGKPILLVSTIVAGARQSGRFGTIRCRRRIDTWKLQEPVYVEEPRWVVIELNRQTGFGHTMGEDDPFYVARGKRSPRPLDDNRRARSTENLVTETNSQYFGDTSTTSVSRRRKRDALSDALRRSSLIENQELSYGRLPGVGADRAKGHAHGYVSPRDKHSDILDILNEPFFISRGKKDSTRSRRFEWYTRYARKKIFDGTMKRDTSIVNCDPTSNDCFVDSMIVASRGNPRSIANPFAFRDRRGVVEELLKEGDPFYVTRGKRSRDSTSTKRRFNDNSSQQSWGPSSTELIIDRPTVPTSVSQFLNENLSVVH